MIGSGGVIPDRIVIDFSEVFRITCAGFGALIPALKRARRHGFTIALWRIRREVLEILEATSIGRLFERIEPLSEPDSSFPGGIPPGRSRRNETPRF